MERGEHKMDVRTKDQETMALAPKLQLPLQAAPINRAMTGSALTGDGGVQPSDWRDILVGVGTGILIGLLL